MEETLQLTANWETVTSGEHLIPLELIRESDENARKVFDDANLLSLAQSFAATDGQPFEACIVRPMREGAFELIEGARRFRAMQLLVSPDEVRTLKCVVTDSGASTKFISLVTSLQKVGLSPLELSAGYVELLEKNHYASVHELAKALGVPESEERTLHNLISLQKLIPDAAAALADERISREHAVVIARESDSDQVKALAACFRPEARDNGAGVTEMVPVLVSVKDLRDWIKVNLRAPELVQPTLTFNHEAEQVQQQEERKLEASADQMLDGAPAKEDPVSDDAPVSGDVVPADEAAPSPAVENDEYALELGRRIERLGKLAKGKFEVCEQLVRHALFKVVAMTNLPCSQRACAILKCDAPSTAMGRTGDDLARALAVFLCADELNPHCEINLMEKLQGGCVEVAPLDEAMAVPATEELKTEGDVKARTEMIFDAYDRIVAALELPESDLASMRETGMTDESLAALLEAILTTGTYARHPKKYDLEFDAKQMSITVKKAVVYSASGQDYITGVRIALEVPDEGKKPKVKNKKKSPANK